MARGEFFAHVVRMWRSFARSNDARTNRELARMLETPGGVQLLASELRQRADIQVEQCRVNGHDPIWTISTECVRCGYPIRPRKTDRKPTKP